MIEEIDSRKVKETEETNNEKKLICLITPIKTGSHFAKMFLHCFDSIGYAINESMFQQKGYAHTDPIYLSYRRSIGLRRINDIIDSHYDKFSIPSREEVRKLNNIYELNLLSDNRDQRKYNFFMCHGSPLSCSVFRNLDSYNITTVRHPYLTLISILRLFENREGHSSDSIIRDLLIYSGSAKRLWMAKDTVKIFVNPWSCKVQRNIFDLIPHLNSERENAEKFLKINPQINRTANGRSDDKILVGIEHSKRSGLLNKCRIDFLTTRKMETKSIEEYFNILKDGDIFEIYNDTCRKYNYE